MKPYYEHGGITIYHGDCLEIMPSLEYSCILSDPPWGISTATDSRRFTRKPDSYWKCPDTSMSSSHTPIVGDLEEFDPRPLITRDAILWGANNFSRHLPHSNGWLIWDKRQGAEDAADNGWPLGECELAWTNTIGHTRIFRNRWLGMVRSSEHGEHYHPSQKPVSLMAWCCKFIPEGMLLDPYMGSGSTLLGAKQAGRRAIGIEIEEKYCEIAAKRLSQEVLQFEEKP